MFKLFPLAGWIWFNKVLYLTPRYWLQISYIFINLVNWISRTYLLGCSLLVPLYIHIYWQLTPIESEKTIRKNLVAMLICNMTHKRPWKNVVSQLGKWNKPVFRVCMLLDRGRERVRDCVWLLMAPFGGGKYCHMPIWCGEMQGRSLGERGLFGESRILCMVETSGHNLLRCTKGAEKMLLSPHVCF